MLGRVALGLAFLILGAVAPAQAAHCDSCKDRCAPKARLSATTAMLCEISCLEEMGNCSHDGGEEKRRRAGGSSSFNRETERERPRELERSPEPVRRPLPRR